MGTSLRKNKKYQVMCGDASFWIFLQKTKTSLKQWARATYLNFLWVPPELLKTRPINQIMVFLSNYIQKLREGAIFTGKWQGHDDDGARTYFAKKNDWAKTYFAKKNDWAKTYFAKKKDWARTFFSKKFDWAVTFSSKKKKIGQRLFFRKKMIGRGLFLSEMKSGAQIFFVPQMMGSRYFFTKI